MRVVIVGATGTIGKAVVGALDGRHDIVAVGNKGGAYQVDLADSASIRALFQMTGRFDALVSTAGKVHYGDFSKMTEREFEIGLKNKLMGQVNLVLIGRDFVNDGGSFTLTSGAPAFDPVRSGVSASLVNGAIHSFVIAAAIELQRGLRINVICPGLLEESVAAYGAYFPGHETVPARRVARAYVKSIEGHQTGQIYKVI